MTSPNPPPPLAVFLPEGAGGLPLLSLWAWHQVRKAGSHQDPQGWKTAVWRGWKPQLLPRTPELGSDTHTPTGKGASDASVQFQKAGDISHPQIIIMIFCNYYLCILHNCHNYYHQLISLPSQRALLPSSALKSDHMGHPFLPLTSSLELVLRDSFRKRDGTLLRVLLPCLSLQNISGSWCFLCARLCWGGR